MSSGISASFPWISEAPSLDREITGPRSPLTTHRQLIEALNDELERMDATEVRQLRLYKVALVIVTIIGMAVAFALPLSMLFGIPLWIPIVTGIGVGLITSIVGSKLRNRCNAIRLKYRALQVYRQQLLSQYPSLVQSTLYKYNIELPKKKLSFKETLQQGLGKLKAVFDGGAQLDSVLNFAGDLPKRHQTSMLVGLDSGPSMAEWGKYINGVKAAKVEIMNGGAGNDAIEAVKQSSLLAAGVDPQALPPGSYIDLARNILGICGYATQVGVEARRSLDRMQRRFLRSETLVALHPISATTKQFMEKGIPLLDFAANTFKKISSLLASLYSSQCLSDFEALGNLFELFIGGDKRLVQRIQDLCHKLGTHDACNEARLGLLLGISRATALMSQDDALSNSNNKLVLKGLLERLREECKKIRLKAGCSSSDSPSVVIEKAEKALVLALINLGDVGSFLDKVRGAVQFGKGACYDVEAVLRKHPESQFVALKCNLERIEKRVLEDSWGAVSNKPFEEVLQEKQNALHSIALIRKSLSFLEGKYTKLQESRLSKVLLQDFSSLFSEFETQMFKVKTFDKGTESTVGFLKDCEKYLKKQSKKIASEALSSEELKKLFEEYRVLLEELAILNSSVHSLNEIVCNEGVSGGSLLLSALTTREKTLDARRKQREREFKAKSQALRSIQHEMQGKDLSTLIQEGIQGLNAIISGMESFNGVLRNTADLQTGNILSSASSLFSAIHEHSSRKFLNLQESLQAASLGEKGKNSATPFVVSGKTNLETEEGFAEGLSREYRSYVTIRHESLEKFLRGVKETINKWIFSEALVNGILSLVAMALGIAFVSTQIVWIMVALGVLTVCMRLVPMAMGYFMEKKFFDARVIETVQKLIPATKILPSEFENENLDHLIALQDSLGLEGFEQAWAREVIRDLDGSPGRKTKTFQNVLKELRKDADMLNTRMKKAFPKENVSSKVASLTRDRKETLQAESFLDEDVIEQELKLLEYQEEVRTNELLKLCTEQATWEREQNNSKTLEKHAESKQKDLQRISEKMTHFLTVRAILLAAIQKAAEKTPPAADADFSDQIQELNTLSRMICRDPKKRENAKRVFREKISEIVSAGNFSLLEAQLELGACSGTCQVRLRDDFEVKTRKALEGQNAEAILEGCQGILNVSGLEDLSPFLRFSSDVAGSGKALARKAKEQLEALQQEITNNDKPSSQDYARALTALSSYLKVQEPLEGQAYAYSSSSEKYKQAAGLMEELYAAEQILTEGIDVSFSQQCNQSLKIARSIFQEQIKKGPHCNVQKELLEIVKSAGTSPSGQPEVDLPVCLDKLEDVPIEVLRLLCREVECQVNIDAKRAQEIQGICQSSSRVSQYVQVKEKSVGELLKEGSLNIIKLKEELKKLGERKQKLLQRRNEILSTKEEESLLLSLRYLFSSEDSK